MTPPGVGAQRLSGLAPRRNNEPGQGRRVEPPPAYAGSHVRAAGTAGSLWVEDLEGELVELVGPPPAYALGEDRLYPDLRLLVEDVDTGLESPRGEGAEVEGRGEAAPFSALTLGKNAGVEKQDVRPRLRPHQKGVIDLRSR